MAVVVNNTGESPGSGMNSLLGIVLLVIVILVLFYWGLPILRRTATPSPSVNVPDKIDVNINNPEGQ